IRSPETSRVERLLLASDLADFPGLDAAGEIERLVDGDDAAVRGAALRSLARHPLGRLELARVALDVLARASDADTRLAVLDACDGVVDVELRAALPALVAGDDPR